MNIAGIDQILQLLVELVVLVEFVLIPHILKGRIYIFNQKTLTLIITSMLEPHTRWLGFL